MKAAQSRSLSTDPLGTALSISQILGRKFNALLRCFLLGAPAYEYLGLEQSTVHTVLRTAMEEGMLEALEMEKRKVDNLQASRSSYV